MTLVATHQELDLSAGSIQRIDLGSAGSGSAAMLGLPL
jgi:hypothetical protein